MKALYGQQPEDMDDIDYHELEVRAVATIRFCLNDDMMYHIMDEESSMVV